MSRIRSNALVNGQTQNHSLLGQREFEHLPQPVQPNAEVPSIEKIDWESADSVKPSSGGGKGGVMFVKIGKEMHVVKAVHGSPSTAIFGEEMVKKISGAETTESRPVKKESAEGMKISELLHKYRLTDSDPDLKLTDEYGKDIWERQYPFFERASYFLVQKTMQSENEFGKVSKSNPMRILGDDELLRNIGKLYAADSLIGNHDRFGQMNLGNVFLSDSGGLAAIDTDAILQNFEAQSTQRGGAQNSKDWAEMLIDKNGLEVVEKDYIGQAAPSSRVTWAFGNFDEWFELWFQPVFKGESGQRAIYSPDQSKIENVDW
jgi:hypothetical protein